MKLQKREKRILALLLCLFCCLFLHVSALADTAPNLNETDSNDSLEAFSESETPSTIYSEEEADTESNDMPEDLEATEAAENTSDEEVAASEDKNDSEALAEAEQAMTENGEDGALIAIASETDIKGLLRMPLKTITEDAVLVLLSGDTVVAADSEAVYSVSLGNMNRVATVTLWFNVDSDYFSGKSIQAMAGFSSLGNISWQQEEDSFWSGRVTLIRSDSGITSKPHENIFELTLATGSRLGDSCITLARVEVSGYNADDVAVFYEHYIEADSVDTKIIPYYSIYDVNRDGVVNQLDLTLAQFYYLAEYGDENWEEAEKADVNGDGRVDIEDLILILNNIDWDSMPNDKDTDGSDDKDTDGSDDKDTDGSDDKDTDGSDDKDTDGSDDKDTDGSDDKDTDGSDDKDTGNSGSGNSGNSGSSGGSSSSDSSSDYGDYSGGFGGGRVLTVNANQPQAPVTITVLDDAVPLSALPQINANYNPSTGGL